MDYRPLFTTANVSCNNSKYIALHDTADVVAPHDDDFICEFLVMVVMP